MKGDKTAPLMVKGKRAGKPALFLWPEYPAHKFARSEIAVLGQTEPGDEGSVTETAAAVKA